MAKPLDEVLDAVTMDGTWKNVLDFNEGKEMGMENLFAHLGVEFTARAQAFFKPEDQLRLCKSQKRASEV